MTTQADTTAAASAVAQFELARSLVARGRSREAVAPLERATRLDPALTRAWGLLGDILLASDQFMAARAAYDRLIASMIRDPRLKAVAGDLAEGRAADAELTLRALLAGGPAHPAAAIHLLGEALRRQARLAEAESVLAGCLVEWPDLHLARQSYALTLMGGRRWSEAVTQLDRLLTRNPGDLRTRMMKAAALTEFGDFAGAADVTETVLAAFPDQPRAWLVHGAGLRTLGRIEESVAALRRCLELDPDCGEAWWALANLKTYVFSDEERATMEAALARPDVGPELGAHLRFALGKAAEDGKRFEAAFDHYRRANLVVRAARPYQPDQTTTLVDASEALFTADFFGERAGWGDASAEPIFIVGLPRSGSTLVDQILASHPAIEGVGELPDIERIAAGLGAPYPDCVAPLTAEACAALGGRYLDETRPLRRLGRPRFSDKAPGNFLHAGLILTILPEARIVDVRRHPLACCVSAWRQHFGGGFAFAYDLADLGRYYADYVRLMAHFDRVAPGRIHRLVYEDLVVDTESEVRRLLAYLDLPFDEACLRFFENDRPVATPSSEQVRQPISTSAIDFWRAYEPWLGPLEQALGPVLETWRN